MEAYQALLQQKWLEDFPGDTKSQSLFKSLEKHFPPESALQMIQFNLIYQKFCHCFVSHTEKVASLQALYWQELFLIWQRFILSEGQTLSNQQELTHFMKDYYALHARHFEGLFKLEPTFDPNLMEKTHIYIKQLQEICAPHELAEPSFESWQYLLEEQGTYLLKCLQALIKQNQAHLM
jgi:hypothetical protein